MKKIITLMLCGFAFTSAFATNAVESHDKKGHEKGKQHKEHKAGAHHENHGEHNKHDKKTA